MEITQERRIELLRIALDDPDFDDLPPSAAPSPSRVKQQREIVLPWTKLNIDKKNKAKKQRLVIRTMKAKQAAYLKKLRRTPRILFKFPPPSFILDHRTVRFTPEEKRRYAYTVQPHSCKIRNRSVLPAYLPRRARCTI